MTLPWLSKDLAKSTCTVMRQAQVTLDIDTYKWMDWAWGGLNLHLVHHLFPKMHPMFARQATKYVKKKFVEMNIPYQSMPTKQAFLMTLRELRNKGLEYSLRI